MGTPTALICVFMLVCARGRYECRGHSKQSKDENQFHGAKPEVQALQPGVTDDGKLGKNPYEHSEACNCGSQQRPVTPSEQRIRGGHVRSAQDNTQDEPRDQERREPRACQIFLWHPRPVKENSQYGAGEG